MAESEFLCEIAQMEEGLSTILLEFKKLSLLKKVIRGTLRRKSKKWGNGVVNEYGVERVKGTFRGGFDVSP
jgi:uncharacterized membrane protein